MNGDVRFDARPKVKTKLSVLPKNPEGEGRGRFPSWLHRPIPKGFGLQETEEAVREERLHTVCEEAKCPNRIECWSYGTATFLAMGRECTRSCGFCEIAHSKTPPPLEIDEPRRIAESIKTLKLKHAVITQVARDDLEDGGAEHLVQIIKEARLLNPETTLELLTFDFGGNFEAIQKVLDAKPDIFNYNIETVRRLTPRVRHKATYERTLQILKFAKERAPASLIKSGLMVGLGEEDHEVKETLVDLKEAGCSIVTIGQYLQPSPRKLLVKEFIHPERFKEWESFGKSIGIKSVFAGPFVRSSYHAKDVFKECHTNYGS